MGLFSSIFGKKENTNKAKITVTVESNINPMPTKTPSFHKKGLADKNGLYPTDLIMLAKAETIKTTEKNIKVYLYEKYGIPNPSKILMSLYEGGYLEPGSIKDYLPNYKVPELKEIATALNVPTKGKKADIVSRLQAVDENELGQYVKEKNWKRTESGDQELNDNPYISFFLENHNYNLEQFDIDVWSVNQDFIKNPKRPYRDIIWGQLNKKQNDYLKEFMSQKDRNTFPIFQYCETFEVMGLFVEEEGKSYINAADYYFQYLYKRINLAESLDLAYYWHLFKGEKEYQKERIERFCDKIQLTQFEKTTVLRLIDECEYEDNAVRDALITSFKRARDSGIMTEEETADYVIFELTGDEEHSKQMAEAAAVRFTKKLK